MQIFGGFRSCTPAKHKGPNSGFGFFVLATLVRINFGQWVYVAIEGSVDFYRLGARNDVINIGIGAVFSGRAVSFLDFAIRASLALFSLLVLTCSFFAALFDTRSCFHSIFLALRDIAGSQLGAGSAGLGITTARQTPFACSTFLHR